MDNQKRFEPIFQKIEKNMTDGDFYAAQQLYKTLFFRFVSINIDQWLCFSFVSISYISRLSKKKDVKASSQLLIKGACDMLKHSQFNNGILFVGLNQRFTLSC